MGHELTFNGEGTAEMFSVRETPWHREGTILREAPSLAEALELGGLDFTVEKRPTRVVLPYERALPLHDDDIVTAGDAGQLLVARTSESAFTTWRTDRELELGAVGPQYSPIQNRTVFQVMEPLLDQGVLQLETGGSLRDGADVWLLGKFDLQRFGPVVREVFADEVVPFALFTNNHNGRRGATVAETPIRVVCANTLGFAEHQMDQGKSRSVNVRHSGDADIKMVEAAEQLFGGIVERYQVIAEQYRNLKAVRLTEEQHARMVLDQVAPDPRQDPRFNPDASTAEMVVERALTRRREVFRLWDEGDGHTGDRSAWEAYNGAVQSLDHNDELWPTRGGSWRVGSLMTGAIATRKDAVLSSLARYIKREGLEVEA